MDLGYVTFPESFDVNTREFPAIIHHGIFKDGTLVAYMEIFIYGQFAVVNKALGHKAHLSNGVVNQLFFAAVEILGVRSVEYLTYLTMKNV